MTATFTPTAAGTYKLTPGDNEQDIAQFNLVVACKASASGPAATITVAPASGGSGTTAPSSSAPTSSSAAAGAGSGSSSSSPTTGVLPHTGFDGRWLAGGAVLAAALGGTGLYATRRRRGTHG
jgi:LPXTG-motif cell wall-anchored protein